MFQMSCLGTMAWSTALLSCREFIVIYCR